MLYFVARPTDSLWNSTVWMSAWAQAETVTAQHSAVSIATRARRLV